MEFDAYPLGAVLPRADRAFATRQHHRADRATHQQKENARSASMEMKMVYNDVLTASVKKTLQDRVNDLEGEIDNLVVAVQWTRDDLEVHESELAHLEAKFDEIKVVLEEMNETAAS
jgi:hypothetical protein